jgi:hypothetical protein
MNCLKCGVDIGNNINRLCSKCSGEISQQYSYSGRKDPHSETYFNRKPAGKNEEDSQGTGSSVIMSGEERKWVPPNPLPNIPSLEKNEPIFADLTKKEVVPVQAETRTIPNSPQTSAVSTEPIPQVPSTPKKEEVPEATTLSQTEVSPVSPGPVEKGQSFTVPEEPKPTMPEPEVKAPLAEPLTSQKESELPAVLPPQPVSLADKEEENEAERESPLKLADDKQEDSFSLPLAEESNLSESEVKEGSQISIQPEQSFEKPVTAENQEPLPQPEIPVKAPVEKTPIDLSSQESFVEEEEKGPISSEGISQLSSESPVVPSEVSEKKDLEVPPSLPEKEDVGKETLPETNAQGPNILLNENLGGSLPPPPNSNLPQGKENAFSQNKPKFGVMKTLFSLFLALFLLVLVSGGALVASSYTNYKLPLLPSRISQMTDVMIASVPLIPKTPKQILTKVVATAEDPKSALKSGYQTVNFSTLVDSGSLSSDSLEIDLKIAGPFETGSEGSIKSSARLDGYIKSSQLTDSFSLEIKQSDSLFYFNIKELPRSLGLGGYLETNQWFKVSLSNTTLYGDYGKYFSSDSFKKLEEQDKQLNAELGDMVEKYKIYERIVRKPDEKVSNADSYRFDLSFDKQTLKNLIKDYLGYYQEMMGSYSTDSYGIGNYSTSDLDLAEQVVQYINEFNISLWVDKTTYYVNRTTVDLSMAVPETYSSFCISPPCASGNESAGSIKMRFDYSLSAANKSQNISFPAEAKEVQSIFDLYNTTSGSTTLNMESSGSSLKRANLLQVASAAERYSTSHNLTYPNSLAELTSSGLLKKQLDDGYKYKVSPNRLYFSVYTPLEGNDQKYLAFKSVDGKVLEVSLSEAESVEVKTIGTPSQVLGASAIDFGLNPLFTLSNLLKRFSSQPLHF